MILASIDTETTSLDPKKGQMIELAIVLFDTHTNKRVAKSWIIHHDHYTGDAFAFAMNKRIFEILASPASPDINVILNEHVLGHIHNFLFENNVSLPVTVVGKNFNGFDLQFFKQIRGFEVDGLFHHRALDIGSLYFNPLTDTELPGLGECKRRAGIPGKVNHTSLDDANDVLDVLEVYYNL